MVRVGHVPQQAHALEAVGDAGAELAAAERLGDVVIGPSHEYVGLLLFPWVM
jgi:hypothetical protein